MNKSDFYFELPENLIAQTPLEKRDASRLMVLDRSTGENAHGRFADIAGLVKPNDCLILNDSRVIPARLAGCNAGRPVEVLTLADRGEDTWECLVKPGKRAQVGAFLEFGDKSLTGSVTGIAEGGNRLIKFKYEGIFFEVLERLGEMPLPPYIKEKLSDPERYQTVYSKVLGSAAAPTAGLHFTDELIEKLENATLGIGYITLHVGLGTFRPVKRDNILEHEMHSEYCEVPEKTAELVERTRAAGGRVIAAGTTSCRTLESFAREDGRIAPGSGWTDIFIYPGYKFKATDALITNFHLPESTLIMLVSALAGRERTLEAYAEAVRRGYRFFSFGDAMVIL